MHCCLVSSWDSFLVRFSPEQKDVYLEERYVRLYENDEETAMCFVAEEDEKCLIFPFLLREFLFGGEIYRDFETPYGYGGPIANSDDIDFVERALGQFMEYGKAQNYIAGFVRFHPLLHNELGFSSIGEVIYDRQTVAIDTNLTQEEMWKTQIHAKNRNVIKKSEKSGLTFVADYEYRYLQEFIALYNATMDKLGADDFYYFTEDYYNRFGESIKSGFIGTVWYDNKIIAAAMFFYSERYGHYHLAGSNREYLSFSPNNFMLWNAALELKRHGVEKFHLGGGTDSDEHNSLFEFKSRFSKDRYDFSIGKVVFNPEKYREICDAWIVRNARDPKVETLRRHLLKYKY